LASPRATLIAVHDLNSHGNYYERFAIHVAARGIAVHAIDLRLSQYGNDIDALMHAERPLFLLGHGAGAVAVSLYALTRQRDLSGLICESIALDLPAVVTLLGWLRTPALNRARNRLRSSLEQLSLPLLALHGSADTVALPSGSEHLHERAGSADKTLQIFEGYHHDLIHEQVTERILQWIEDRLKPEPRNQIGIAYINPDT